MKSKVLIHTFLVFLLTGYCSTTSTAQNTTKKQQTLDATNVKYLAKTKKITTDNLVQWALRESYMENMKDLKAQVEKIKHNNQQKKAIRDHLSKTRQTVSPSMAIHDYLIELKILRTEVILAGAQKFRANRRTKRSPQRMNDAIISDFINRHAHSYSALSTKSKIRFPNRVPRTGINSLKELDIEIARWDKQLNSLGEDGQLFNIDLQNATQKQQQYIQMLSNISKMIHETEMGIIRNMKD